MLAKIWAQKYGIYTGLPSGLHYILLLVFDFFIKILHKKKLQRFVFKIL